MWNYFVDSRLFINKIKHYFININLNSKTLIIVFSVKRIFMNLEM